jgi:multiple sugar transport system permease protein
MSRVRKFSFYGLLIFYSVLTIVPFLWSLSTSFKPSEEVYQSNLIPEAATMKAYATVFGKIQPNFQTLFANSLFIACVVVFVEVFVVSVIFSIIALFFNIIKSML